jgi:hypothetical protein
MTPDDIAKDRASIQKFRSELGEVPFLLRGSVANALNRWEIALNEVEKLQSQVQELP